MFLILLSSCSLQAGDVDTMVAPHDSGMFLWIAPLDFEPGAVNHVWLTRSSRHLKHELDAEMGFYPIDNHAFPGTYVMNVPSVVTVYVGRCSRGPRPRMLGEPRTIAVASVGALPRDIVGGVPNDQLPSINYGYEGVFTSQLGENCLGYVLHAGNSFPHAEVRKVGIGVSGAWWGYWCAGNPADDPEVWPRRGCKQWNLAVTDKDEFHCWGWEERTVDEALPYYATCTATKEPVSGGQFVLDTGGAAVTQELAPL